MNKERLYLVLLIISVGISIVLLFGGMLTKPIAEKSLSKSDCTQIILPEGKVFYCCGEYHFNSEGIWNGHCEREYEIEIE